MFETAELERELSKSEYARRVPELRTQLLRVQNELLASAQFSVIIVIAGVDGAGKGDTVNVLHQWMDPRFLETHAIGEPTDEERERPPMWRFWRGLPPKGRTGIFFGSWYTDPILRRVYGESSDLELEAALAHVNVFEKQLVDDGTLLVKFWFHLSKKAQEQRLKTLSGDPKLSWRVTDRDWKHFGLYDKFVAVSDRVIRGTSTGEAPWRIIEGSNSRYRDVSVGQYLRDAIENHSQSLAKQTARVQATAPAATDEGQPTIISRLDLSKRVEKRDYPEQLETLQGELNLLSRKMRKRGISASLVFEGWDAAGKGSAIRRVTAALDARIYRIVPVAAPSAEERSRHYLWRFWRQIPRTGQITIFDRSWYGRVLVERVEGLASEEQWRRAYREINEFEELLSEDGMVVLKFWLHLSKDEQLRRFQAREQTSYKQFKITAEDYRNREKWDLYAQAVNEMVERTSTAQAPWTLVESNDKRYARLKVLRTCCEQLDSAIREAKKKR